MPIFNYKAKRHDGGEEYEGETEAQNRFEVYDHIRKENATVISIEEKNERSVKSVVSSVTSFGGRIKMSEKIVVARNLATMIKAGLAITRALSVMGRQSKNRKLKSVLAALEQHISKGGTFHEALSQFPDVFSPLMVSMVRAGEESGKMAEALIVVSEQMERSYQLQKKIRGALIYPVIIVLAMIVIGILMLIYVVPTLTQTFNELGVELPRSTKVVIGVSSFLTDNTVISLSALIIFGALLAAALRTRAGRRLADFVVLHLPLIAPMAREVNAARTARTLSSLLSAGVEMIAAIGITRDVVQNSYYKDILSRAEKDVQQGVQLSKVLEESGDTYPVLVAEMVAVGEETGQLSSMLHEVAEFYESEIDQQTKDLSTVIEPFLMLIIGTVVGFFAISMISPIYSLSGGI
ncbi:MAG TPA: type II secretion system F family protein [Candidatus Paceibacterota bacterium]|jgi:type IV pilus assembly protein PilC